MCEPATLMAAGLALSAVTAGVSLKGQSDAAHAQSDANQQQYQNEMTAYRANLASNEVTRGQVQADTSAQLNMNNQAARRAVATATTSAGEAGATGLSVDALVRDIAGRAGFDNTNVEENYLRQNHAIDVKGESIYNGTASGINSLKAPTMPDYLGTTLRLGSQAASTYGTYKASQLKVTQ